MKALLKTAAAAFALSGALIAAPAAAQDFTITNATVGTGDGSEPIEGANVTVRGGKVVAVGTGAPTSGTVIDGTGKWVTPGIVIALTDLGLYDVSGVSNSNDIGASRSRFAAAIDVAPAINPASQHIKVSRAAGITRALVTPGHGPSIFAGQGALIDLGDDPDAVQQARAFQLVDLGETGARIAGGSRSAAYVELGNALKEARDFAVGRRKADDALLTRADAEALVPVVTGKQQLYVEVERAADIRQVLSFKRSNPRLKLVLVGASEGWLVASDIARTGVPVIADGLDDLPSSFEQLGATQSNVGRMHAAGVKVAIGRLAGGTDGHPRSAAQFAGNLVALGKVPGAKGLSWGQALATITSLPAEIAGHGGKFGVIAPGAPADIVLWDGDPLEVSTAPTRVFIDGVEQPMDSHQTELAKRYRDLDESDLPKAYDW
ncbi:MAG: amidohydrolase family protein [Marinomonas sp.]